MPREKKKRGRRDNDKKRKLDASAEENSNKRRRHSNDDLEHQPEEVATAASETEHEQEHHEVQDPNTNGGAFPHPADMPFYGLLDEEEQEYFRRAHEMIELDQFSGPEDRENFLSSVYKEAEDKELKIACSQSCSRLLERLIQSSSTVQLKSLFQKFSGHFLHLVQHRFASHCCEALFIRAAPTVSTEIKAPPVPSISDPNEILVTMEDLYLHAVKELQENLGYLMNDRFASHVLRVLFAVLAGLPLAPSQKGSILHSKKKENLHAAHDHASLDKRVVPESFTAALESLVTQTVSGYDTSFLQGLSTHPTANPTLQLLLKLELTVFGKRKAKSDSSLIHKLLPDDHLTEDSVSGKFINSSIYDPLGSRLLETILEYAPGKLFKQIYRTFFKPRLASLARNDIACYSVTTVLNRLGKDDLQEAMEALVSQMPMLVDRSRTVVIRSLIERCAARDVDPSPIASALAKAYGGPNGLDITQLLKLSDPAADSASTAPPRLAQELAPTKAQQASEKLHASLLAQAMIAVPGELSELIFDALANLGAPLSLQIAKDQNASRTLQAALMAPHASVIHRRKITRNLQGNIGVMALDPHGSRVVDAMWVGTNGIVFMRERIAEELAENEPALRESVVGRAVWRNWKMDLFKRKRRDWLYESKVAAGNDSFLGFPEEAAGEEEGDDRGKAKAQREGRQLTAIEKARLKHAEKKVREEKAKAREEKTSQQNGKRKAEEEVEEEAVAPAAEGEAEGSTRKKRRRSSATAEAE